MELTKVRQKLLDYRPNLVDLTNRRSAAVALIMREGKQGAEILFIERAWLAGDPWSGQMAFPGGKKDSSDDSLLETALRESREEVGIELVSSKQIGRLDDLAAPPTSPAHGLVVSCYAFELEENVPIRSNSEVHDTIWIPISWMLDSGNYIAEYRPRDYDGVFPGIRVAEDDSRVIWGLTYRFLQGFMKILRSDFDFRLLAD